jgi:hypothetical protein
MPRGRRAKRRRAQRTRRGAVTGQEASQSTGGPSLPRTPPPSPPLWAAPHLCKARPLLSPSPSPSQSHSRALACTVQPVSVTYHRAETALCSSPLLWTWDWVTASGIDTQVGPRTPTLTITLTPIGGDQAQRHRVRETGFQDPRSLRTRQGSLSRCGCPLLSQSLLVLVPVLALGGLQLRWQRRWKRARRRKMK